MLYLTDEADMLIAYEKRGREKRPSVSSYESGMEAFQNLGRIPQVEAMHGKLPIYMCFQSFYCTLRLDK